LKNVLQVIQNKYTTLSAKELKFINKVAEEEADRIALTIAQQPPPGIPEFPMDFGNEEGSPFLTDDDRYEGGGQRSTGSNGEFGLNGEGFGNDQFNNPFDDFFQQKEQGEQEGYQKEKSREAAVLPSEEERNLECHKMKTDYNILIGVSWGDLPYDLQEKWRTYRCDVYFSR
jgi:hypothetical protein